MNGEPSTFALDVYYAGGARGDPELDAHVASCERCSAYLDALRAQPPAPPVSLGRRRGTSWQLMAAASAAACCAMLLWFSQRPDGYVASKGVPAIQALIRSQGTARVWDGKSAIRPGDAIAIRADCDRFERISVLVPAAISGEQAGRAWSRVFSGPCPKSGEALPFSLVADEKPGREQIDVVFSQSALDDAALNAALRAAKRGNGVWVSQLLLEKTGPQP
jgi:hypothetical protein